MASAIVEILERVVQDYPEVTKIVTWSDGCVPQNRNSIMSFAVIEFLSGFDDYIQYYIVHYKLYTCIIHA